MQHARRRSAARCEGAATCSAPGARPALTPPRRCEVLNFILPRYIRLYAKECLVVAG